MYACALCGAAVTNSGRRLVGPICFFCGGPLEHVEPQPIDPNNFWAPVLTEALNRQRASLRAESEV
jgi:hypothetical protein